MSPPSGFSGWLAGADPPQLFQPGLTMNVNGGSVSGSSWNDVSGQGNNGTLTASPTAGNINGRSALTFNGTSQYATFATIATLMSGTAFSVFVVVNPIATSSSATSFSAPYIFGDAGQQLGLTVNKTPILYAFADESPHQTNQAVTLNTPMVVYARWSSGSANTLFLSVNGGAETSVTTAGNITVTSAALSCAARGASGQDLNCTIANIATYNTLLTQAQAMQNVTYLGIYYGITV